MKCLLVCGARVPVQLDVVVSEGICEIVQQSTEHPYAWQNFQEESPHANAASTSSPQSSGLLCSKGQSVVILHVDRGLLCVHTVQRSSMWEH
jgi:hypothetical protein